MANLIFLLFASQNGIALVLGCEQMMGSIVDWMNDLGYFKPHNFIDTFRNVRSCVSTITNLTTYI
ncbi:unnamed protein product [Albugo candida]|uniref:Uncharacterized protein n=1 Tax=Albugo candida TaxID=65357 RepID=A0A024GQT7_9STRA|nr:unnamed protein product [Albugo candida]|eukprot:CCI48723.1 unnamed protein product [Albugo candida]